MPGAAIQPQRANVGFDEVAGATDDAAEEKVAGVSAHGKGVGVEVDVAVDVENGQEAEARPELGAAHVHVGIDGVGALGVVRGDAIGDENRIAAHEIIRALEEQRVEGAIGAEVVGHEQLGGGVLEYQVIARHRGAADPIAAIAEVAIDGSGPKLCPAVRDETRQKQNQCAEWECTRDNAREKQTERT